MSSYFPPPPYEELDSNNVRRRDDFYQHQITRRPVLPARPKTANIKEQHGLPSPADPWATSAGTESMPVLDRNHSQWESARRNATTDTHACPRTAGSRARPKPQFDSFPNQWAGSAGVPLMGGVEPDYSRRELPSPKSPADPRLRHRTATSGVGPKEQYDSSTVANQHADKSGQTANAGLNHDSSRWESQSPRPNLMVAPQARPRTAVSREGLRDKFRPPQTANQWAGNPRVGLVAVPNVDHARWESNLTINTTHVRPRTAESRPGMVGRTGSYNSSSTSSISPFPSSSTLLSPPSPLPSPKGTNMQKAFEEARHFAGGLISHPCETNKHYSILRHSHGLVFYQGPSTTLAISIFADAPLPLDSTLWLQNKGWTGKTGMRIKALFGVDDSWLNVTPTMSIGSQQLKPTDERAWQRDIAKFRKKAVGHKREWHKLRTTAIVRIPAEAEDGYFQLVLCLGDKKKVLCNSPSFRILSASANPHSIRGASLLTMPLELGMMAAGVYAKATAGRVVGPVVSVATSRVQKYMPSAVTQKITSSVFSHAQVTEKITTAAGDLRNHSMQARDASYSLASAADTGIGSADVRLEHGPQIPYPVCFIASSELSRTEHTNLPCVRIPHLPELITRKLHGYYLGWARSVDSEKKSRDAGDWNQAIISVLSMDASQVVRASITEANKRTTTVQFTEDSESISLPFTSLEVKVMGFIRADDPSQRAHLTSGLQASDEAAIQAAIAVYMNDVSAVQSFLDHPSWGPDWQGRQGIPERPGGLSRMKSSFADAASKIPLDKMGIRSPIDSVRDKSLMVNGFWVPR